MNEVILGGDIAYELIKNPRFCGDTKKTAAEKRYTIENKFLFTTLCNKIRRYFRLIEFQSNFFTLP